MTPQQKIQAAIAALPNATGGEWVAKPEEGEVAVAHTGTDFVCLLNMKYPRQLSANASILAAAKDLAEEVVRLRMLMERIRQHGNRTSTDAQWMQMAAAHGIDPKWPAPKGCVIISSTL
jgi:hypothetical protein